MLLSDGLRRFLPTITHPPTRGVDEVSRSLMPISFQGPISEESLTIAAAAAKVPLSTFEEEEASGFPTDGLVPLTPTAAPKQVVTSVSVS